MNQQIASLWNNCLSLIKDSVSENTFNTWFAPIVPLKYENQEFTIQVPNRYFYEIIESQFIDLLRNTLFRVVGKGTKLMYSVKADMPEEAPTEKKNKAKEQPAEPFRKKIIKEVESNLNKKCTFDNYIEGKTNKLARTAGISVSQNPGKTAFNPLFLHGESGVGKTHLANAIGMMTKELHPDKNILYTTANLFQQQFSTSTLNNDRNSFLNFYQQIDVLIIDDIHEFASQTGTQNAMFHIFNYLHQAGKQLVFTSDRAPSLLQGFENRLISRFRWGLPAEIEKPDVELRKTILNKKIADGGLKIPADVVDYIAETVNENRCLEGILTSLMAHSKLEEKTINIELAQKVISSVMNIVPKKLTVENIREIVCNHLNVPIESVMSKTRKQELVQARQIAMYLAKQLSGQSLSHIGLKIGNRDHATVLHACKVVSDQMIVNKAFKSTVEDIEKKLKR